MTNNLYVVYKNISVDFSVIGVCASMAIAKDMCKNDYTDVNNSSSNRYYTIEEYVLNDHYPNGVYHLMDYVPNKEGDWSEMSIQRNVVPALETDETERELQ